jgi:hypothetical protein
MAESRTVAYPAAVRQWTGVCAVRIPKSIAFIAMTAIAAAGVWAGASAEAVHFSFEWCNATTCEVSTGHENYGLTPSNMQHLAHSARGTVRVKDNSGAVVTAFSYHNLNLSGENRDRGVPTSDLNYLLVRISLLNSQPVNEKCYMSFRHSVGRSEADGSGWEAVEIMDGHPHFPRCPF